MRVEEQRSEELHRHVRVARVVGLNRDGTPDSLPLYDPTLVFVRPDVWTMTGFERLESGDGKPICHLQSWALRPVTEAILRNDDWARQQSELSRQFSEHIANFAGPPAPARRSRRRR